MIGGDDEPLLSPDETNALLSAMSLGMSARVDSLQLGSTDGQLRDALKVADRQCAQLAVAVRKLLVRVLSCSARTSKVPSEIRTYGSLHDDLQLGSCIALFRLAKGEGTGLVTFGAGLVAYSLERRLGVAEAHVVDAPISAPLSRMDRRLLRPIVVGLVEALSTLKFGSKDALELVDIVAHAGELEGRLPTNEPVLRLGVRLDRGDSTPEEVAFIVDGGVVRAEIPESVQVDPAAPPPPPELSMAEILPGIDVETTALLGTTGSTVRAVLALDVGDVIRLDSIPGEPLLIVVGDTVALRGMPVVYHGNMALEVTSTASRA